MKITTPQWLKDTSAAVIAVGVILAVSVNYKNAVAADAKEQVEPLTKKVVSNTNEINILKEELRQHVKEEQRAHIELQEDSRALYRAMIDKRPSPRLEQPPTLAGDAGLLARDGGP